MGYYITYLLVKILNFINGIEYFLFIILINYLSCKNLTKMANNSNHHNHFKCHSCFYWCRCPNCLWNLTLVIFLLGNYSSTLLLQSMTTSLVTSLVLHPNLNQLSPLTIYRHWILLTVSGGLDKFLLNAIVASRSKSIVPSIVTAKTS